MPNLHIGTLGYPDPRWSHPVFLPPRITTGSTSALRYYASRFDAIEITGNHFLTLTHQKANKMLEAVKNNPRFRFHFLPLGALTRRNTAHTFQKAWKTLWEGNKKHCGLRVFHEQHRLGCLVLRFERTFSYHKRSLSYFQLVASIIPPDIRLAFEFHHVSWRDHQTQVEEIFRPHPQWGIVTSYIENQCLVAGWFGLYPSTRTGSTSIPLTPIITTNFLYYRCHGTLGPGLGSYDQDDFLERLTVIFSRGLPPSITDVYIIFCNGGTTFQNPFPHLSDLSPFRSLPQHTTIDRPGNLHDALRLRELWKTLQNSPYEYDERGFVKLTLLSNFGEKFTTCEN